MKETAKPQKIQPDKLQNMVELKLEDRGVIAQPQDTLQRVLPEETEDSGVIQDLKL
jgi:hypothetical protein